MNGSMYLSSGGGDLRKLFLLLLVFLFVFFGYSNCKAQSNCNHVQAAFGLLYERGMDVTLSYEHESRYHNAWEYFVNGYLKWYEDPVAGHVTTDSFWNSYNTWEIGLAYKPCVIRCRNNHGNARLGFGGGSDLHRFVGYLHVGYEHSFALCGGWELFFRVKEDISIKGRDLFRTGADIGVKIPLNGGR